MSRPRSPIAGSGSGRPEPSPAYCSDVRIFRTEPHCPPPRLSNRQRRGPDGVVPGRRGEEHLVGPAGTRRGTVLVIAGMAAAVSGCGLFGSSPKPDSAAATFLAAWSRNDLAGAAAATDAAGTVPAALRSITAGLGAGAHPDLSAGAASVTGNTATVSYHASWTLPGVGSPWTYDGRLALVRSGNTWQVHWEPSDVQPQLSTGDTLAVRRQLPPRADLLDAAGNPLFSQEPVVTVGIEPKLVTDLPGLANTLATVLNVSPSDIITAARQARPTDFVPVITLREPAYL